MKNAVIAGAMFATAMCAVTSANATLAVRSAYQDAALSIDGFGGSSGTLSADVASGSTVLAAYVYASSVWTSALTNFTFEGTTFTPAQGSLLVPNTNPATTNIYDVTSIVKPIIDGGAGGLYNFTISDVNNDGEVLVVVYRNASTAGGTAIIMDGELATTGDTTTLTFASPYAGGDVIMSLASSFSYNGNSDVNATGQVTTIDVTTDSTINRRLTGCAGGNDDGGFVAQNGALMTVGGVGDNPANPDPNCAGGAGDDELYNLGLGNSADVNPFLAVGDTFLRLDTLNPSNDDNVFGLFFTSTFRISDVDGNPIDGRNSVPAPGSLGLLGAGLAGLASLLRRKTV